MLVDGGSNPAFDQANTNNCSVDASQILGMEASTPLNTLSQRPTGTTLPHHGKSSSGLHEDDASHHLACDKFPKTEGLSTISSYYEKTSMASDAGDLSYHSNGEATFQMEDGTSIMHCCTGQLTVFEVGDVSGHSQGERELQGANVGTHNFISTFSEHQPSSNPCTAENISSMGLLKGKSNVEPLMNVLDDHIIIDHFPIIPHSDPEKGPESSFSTFPPYDDSPSSSLVGDLSVNLLSETNSKSEDVGTITCYHGDRSEPLGVSDVSGPSRGVKDSQGEDEGTQGDMALFPEQQSFSIADSFRNDETPKLDKSNAEPSVIGSGDLTVSDCSPISHHLEEECHLGGGEILDDTQASNEGKKEIKEEIKRTSRSLRTLLSSEVEENRPCSSNEKAGDSTDTTDKGTPTARSLQRFPDSWYDHADNVEYPTGAFSGPIVFSGSIASAVPYPYSGSLSHRSDSTTSTRSFAFPILASEWNTSPVTMGQPASHYFRRRRKSHCCCCCW